MTSADAGRRPLRRDAAENRELILVAAADALAEASDTSLDAIARAAGLSRRAVYGHFANRDDLVLALIERGAERLNAIATTTDHSDAAVSLALLGARLWDAVAHVRLLAAMAVQQPYVHHAAGALAPLRAHLLAVVERGVADGRLRADLPVTLVGHLIERAALAVLGEATAVGADAGDDPDPRRTVMLAVLGTAGLSWREAGELIDRTPALATGEDDR